MIESHPIAFFFVLIMVIWGCGFMSGLAWSRMEIQRHKQRAELYRLGLNRSK